MQQQGAACTARRFFGFGKCLIGDIPHSGQEPAQPRLTTTVIRASCSAQSLQGAACMQRACGQAAKHFTAVWHGAARKVTGPTRDA